MFIVYDAVGGWGLHQCGGKQGSVMGRCGVVQCRWVGLSMGGCGVVQCRWVGLSYGWAWCGPVQEGGGIQVYRPRRFIPR